MIAIDTIILLCIATAIVFGLPVIDLFFSRKKPKPRLDLKRRKLVNDVQATYHTVAARRKILAPWFPGLEYAQTLSRICSSGLIRL